MSEAHVVSATSSSGSSSAPSSSSSSSSSSSAYPTGEAAYDKLAAIGYGASSAVWHARLKERKEVEVAVKVMSLENRPSQWFDEIRKEIQQLVECSHDNIVRYFTSFLVDNSLWIVMEYLGGGSCLDLIKYAFPKGFDEPSIATVLRETLKGIAYIHRTGRIHRDLKAGNILINLAGEVKIADFGVSASMLEGGERKQRTTFVGTPCWMAPEVMEQTGYDNLADIWSFGITAIELAKGQAPAAHLPPMKVIMRVLRHPPPQLDRETNAKGVSRFSKEFKDLVENCCLLKEPKERSSADELLKHKFFKAAKKPEYIYQTLLSKLPSLPERAKSVSAKEIKEIEQVPLDELASMNIESRKPGESWDFSEADVEAIKGEQDAAGGDAAAATTTAAASAATTATATATTAGDAGAKVEQKGRFKMTSTPATTQPPSAAPAPAPAPTSAPAVATAPAAAPAADASAASGGTKVEQKGRFKVTTSSNK